MSSQDLLSELRWGALLLGTSVAVLAQVVLTLLVIQPLGLSLGWAAVGLVEVSIVLGAFVAAWRARQAAVLHGSVTALICALISSGLTAASDPGSLNIWSLAFLFGTFAAMGALGGLLAGHIAPRPAADPFANGASVRRLGGRL